MTATTEAQTQTTTHHYRISAGFARREKLPTSLVAVALNETSKAVYLYGHGDVDPGGKCAICGRALTHEGSILIGIGPECLGDWASRNTALTRLSTEEIAEIRQARLHSVRIDQWVPRGVIVEWQAVEEQINAPADHAMLQTMPAKGNSQPKTKRATQIKFKNSQRRGIKIEFPFDRDTVNNVKSLAGRRFHSDGKYWTAPLSLDAVNSLVEWGFEIDDDLRQFRDSAYIAPATDQTGTIEVPGLKGELYPFQRRGVEFIESRNGRALISDSPGLGKTIQALAWLQLHPEARPAVVVCPASVKLNWHKEAELWMDQPKVQIISGRKGDPDVIDPKAEILVINYDILRNQYRKGVDASGKKRDVECPYTGWVDYIIKMRPQVIITDEAHNYKDNKSQRTKAVKKLCKRARHVIGLTGTPILNRPIEIYNALRVIDSTVVPRFWDFAKRYANATHTGFGWDVSGASNTAELHERLTRTLLIRRRKEDVLTDLPAKLYSYLPLELSNQRDYRRAERDFIAYLRADKGEKAANRAKRAEILTRIEGLKHLSAQGKLGQATNWIDDFLDTGNKLVVFANHRDMIDELAERYGNRAVRLDGLVSAAQRQKAVDRFQNEDGVQLFIGQIQAAGEGITLTAANDVAFLELPWTPGALVQCEDRCHRIGTEGAVNIYYLLAQDTIDERIARLIDHKRAVLDSVIDGAAPDESTMLSALIEAYSEEDKT